MGDARLAQNQKGVSNHLGGAFKGRSQEMKTKILIHLMGTLLGTLFFLNLIVGCNTEIHHGLEEDQANEIVTVLRKSGIKAEKEKEKGRKPKFTVLVPKEEAAKAFSILTAHNLPKKQRKGVYELFGKSSLVPTSTEEHMKKVYATASELAKTLEKMEGVLDARVHLVLPKKDFLEDENKKKEKPRASVFLKVVPHGAPATVPQVQGLVAGAVAGLDPNLVSVLIQPGAKLDVPKSTASSSSPMWLKYLAIGACASVLVLGILLAVVGIRLKRLKNENLSLSQEHAEMGTGAVEMEGTSSRAFRA